MRRSATATALVLAIALVLSVAAIARSEDGETTTIPRRTVLTFLDITVREAFLDVEPKAQTEEDVGRGDSFYFHDRLWNLTRTQRRGTLDGRCEILTGPVAHCDATMFLRGGTVELSQTIRFAEEGRSFRVAVVGGTGRYRNVTGQATITEQRRDRARLTLELIPASAGGGASGRLTGGS